MDTPTPPPTSPTVPETASPITDVAQESRDLWTCAFDAYYDWLSALVAARTFSAVCAANTKFAADAAQVVTHAAGGRQRWRGVVTPTLHDS